MGASQLRFEFRFDTYWLTFKSSMVPLSSFTLFFSELKSDPCVPLGAGPRLTFEIPMTPCVFAVIGGR